MLVETKRQIMERPQKGTGWKTGKKKKCRINERGNEGNEGNEA